MLDLNESKIANFLATLKNKKSEIIKDTLIKGVAGGVLSGSAIYINDKLEEPVDIIKNNKGLFLGISTFLSSVFGFGFSVSYYTDLRTTKKNKLKEIKNLEETVVDIQNNLFLEDWQKQERVTLTKELLKKATNEYNQMK